MEEERLSHLAPSRLEDGNWHDYVGVMNYCQMHNGVMNFDAENQQIVYYNIHDDKP